MKEKTPLEKLKDDVHYLIVAHCKYKDMLMYDRALKQFQEDINYGQLEEMSYDERFAFLLGFETSLKAIDNAIKTKQEAETEAKRRNLLTRFRAFRDECNGDWKADFKNKTAKNEAKWNISYYNGKLQAACTNTFNDFAVFGYFKKKRGALRAIELFGKEIIELYVNNEV